MSWYFDRPYVTVAERRREALAAAKKLSKDGRALAPVVLATKKIANTFWGKAWGDNLEAYSDFANRLPRGRSYIRNGAVIDLQITAGKVEALVQGSALYEIAIKFSTLAPQRWEIFKTRSAGKVTNLLDLLQGRLSKEILADITAQDAGLFPAPKEIGLSCSCPDWADMCKHIAAVLYGVGARLDEKPELFFILRGVDMEELLAAASTTATVSISGAMAPGTGIDEADFSEIFGVEIEAAAPLLAAAGRAKGIPKKRSVKPTAKAKPAAKVKPSTKVKPAAKAQSATKARRKPAPQ